MDRSIDQGLAKLQGKLLVMGEHVERAIEHTLHGLTQSDLASFDQVQLLENEVNRLHKEIDEAVLVLLAKESPLAADLRLILAVFKINSDLERMADQAINIARHSRDYLKNAPLKPLVDLPKMMDAAKEMVRGSLDAFVHRDVERARAVLERDDFLDAGKEKIQKELMELIKKFPEKAESAMSLVLIARNLERIGDHATNIAEDVIFIITGQDVRHLGKSN